MGAMREPGAGEPAAVAAGLAVVVLLAMTRLRWNSDGPVARWLS